MANNRDQQDSQSGNASSSGSRGSGSGDMSVREAGQRGGEATSATHDTGFYQQMGHKGGEIGGEKGGQRVRELIDKGKQAEGDGNR